MECMTSLERLTRFAEDKLGVLESGGLRRELSPTYRRRDGVVERDGRTLISFCDNDYLSLACDPRLAEVACYAARRFGMGAGASRLVSGDHPLNMMVEARLAVMKDMPAARLFGSGYLANVGTIPALVGRGDTILMDELSHACMHAGARLSGATIRIFRHNDVRHAARLMEDASGQVLVLTETVFSMDGDRAPIAALGDLCEDHGAWLMTDDAHGFGIIETCNPAHVQMGTLSKAAGVYGGYVCGPRALCDLLTSRARSFVYTTGLPPPVLAAILKTLDIIEAEPGRGEAARANARRFCELAGLPPPDSVIVPVIFGREELAVQASASLLEHGFLVTAIRPPTVPAGTARLRFTFSAGHKQEDIERLAAALNIVRTKLCAPIM